MGIIEVKNLWYAYKPEKYVLEDITLSFDVRPTAIVGENGAGKTTFVKLLKGLLKPVKGDVFIKGQNTKEATVAQLAKVIGLVFQNPSDQIFKSKVIDEVMFGPLNIFKDKHLSYEKSLKALELVGLEDKKEIHPYDLTLSERKLLCLASVLAMEPEIIILDEPTIAQDRYSISRIAEIVKNLVQSGKIILTITHDMDFVLENFERTIVFCKGKVISDGPTKEVLKDESKIIQTHLELPTLYKLHKAIDKK
ncbi:ABC transporter ATP-binding protein [Fervidobacterium sp. 2310opik-2]|uniref:energy-coupling factor ABC transporter ATP-binding protein n=1 Tax=Fervidobacterium sp. 2310opik-2 TaxID=1755815 RepID=UPI0013E07257|nr:ABC transporter ATP-binding protein [Fervidobacterium sp. 2310opik-2]KAF2962375.1 cobalt ABC transporter ATP-binding protein [Fervidobacterium sp. 2310opik-2]